jgi:pimeloyl-ACP methyl ester carboxylesterase
MIFSKVRWVILILITGIMVAFHSCISFRMTYAEIDQYFTSNNLSATQHRYQQGFREMHYVKAGDNSKPLVLFLHGSPGSSSAFIHFLTDTTLRREALLITADRPGFGASNFGNGEPSLKKQAEFLKPILDQYHENRPLILVGHSLAGALVVRMAAEYPQLVDGVVIVAGSVDPNLEPEETWFRAPLATPFLSWVLPGSFRASNEEIYQLKPELQRMLPLWKLVRCPVIVIQGKADSLVPYQNAEFTKRMLVNAPVEVRMIDGMDHFVPWSHPHLITDAILNLLHRREIPSEQLAN